MQFKQIKNDLMEALAANKPKTSPYDTEAEVVRVEGGTAWVHIPGGVDETPVAMTINASAGDTVRVRVGNGTAWLVGNDTAPPTDDTLAKEAIDQFTARWAKIGTAIIETLKATGINADWINTGALVIYDDDNNEIFRADKTNRIFRWNMEHSQMEEDGDMTLRNTAEVNDNEDAESPSFTSNKKVIRHYSSGTPAVEVNNTTIKYGESIEFNSQYLQYVTEALYEQGQAATEKVYTGTMSPIDGIYYWDSYDQRTSHLNFNRGGDAAGAYLQLQNRYIEPFWANSYQNVISASSNMNNYVTPGTYVCVSAANAATVTNAPFTNSSFQCDVHEWGEGSMRMQIAWQNSTSTYIKYRIRNSSGAWGSWYSLARTSDIGGASAIFTAASGYTQNISNQYRDGTNHYYGFIEIGKSSGSFSTTSTAVMNSTIAPSSGNVFLQCELSTNRWAQGVNAVAFLSASEKKIYITAPATGYTVAKIWYNFGA